MLSQSRITLKFRVNREKRQIVELDRRASSPSKFIYRIISVVFRVTMEEKKKKGDMSL